jgi:hypothetical protein
MHSVVGRLLVWKTEKGDVSANWIKDRRQFMNQSTVKGKSCFGQRNQNHFSPPRLRTVTNRVLIFLYKQIAVLSLYVRILTEKLHFARQKQLWMVCI